MRGAPAWNYLPSQKAAKYRIEDRIDLKTARKIVTEYGSPLGKKFNQELIEAFFAYEAEFPIDGIKAFDDYSEAFPLSRSVRIPVKPLTVVRENGEFTPLFLCPWSKLSFSHYQASLLMTILEKAVFTHSDFENSNGRIMFFPKKPNEAGKLFRKPVIWTRGQFPLLSDKELSEQISIFFESKSLALSLYQNYLSQK